MDAGLGRCPKAMHWPEVPVRTKAAKVLVHEVGGAQNLVEQKSNHELPKLVASVGQVKERLLHKSSGGTTSSLQPAESLFTSAAPPCRVCNCRPSPEAKLADVSHV